MVLGIGPDHPKYKRFYIIRYAKLFNPDSAVQVEDEGKAEKLGVPMWTSLLLLHAFKYKASAGRQRWAYHLRRIHRMYLKEAQREPCCVDALCAIRVPQPRLRLQPTRPRSLRFLFLPFYATSRRYFSIFCVLFFFFFFAAKYYE